MRDASRLPVTTTGSSDGVVAMMSAAAASAEACASGAAKLWVVAMTAVPSNVANAALNRIRSKYMVAPGVRSVCDGTNSRQPPRAAKGECDEPRLVGDELRDK